MSLRLDLSQLIEQVPADPRGLAFRVEADTLGREIDRLSLELEVSDAWRSKTLARLLETVAELRALVEEA
jgi:hypothetical protein